MTNKKKKKNDQHLKIICIIQARINSKRLPNKVILEALGKSLLEHMIDRKNQNLFQSFG